MIRSFADDETQKISEGKRSRYLPPEIQQTAFRKLLQIEAATSLKDLEAPPGNRLEALKGNRKGQYSIRINQQWRVCFHWSVHGAESVEIVDYH